MKLKTYYFLKQTPLRTTHVRAIIKGASKKAVAEVAGCHPDVLSVANDPTMIEQAEEGVLKVETALYSGVFEPVK